MPRPRLAFALAALAAALTCEAALAQARPQPTRLGAFRDWTAATLDEGSHRVCYAFTRAARSEGAPANRGGVTLTVAHRPGGRDQVAVSVGYSFARAAEAAMTVGTQEFRAYAVQATNAFFQNGALLIGAFRVGRDALVRSSGPGGRGTVTDTFSLVGFTAAYEAISRECPPQARPGR